MATNYTCDHDSKAITASARKNDDALVTVTLTRFNHNTLQTVTVTRDLCGVCDTAAAESFEKLTSAQG